MNKDVEHLLLREFNIVKKIFDNFFLFFCLFINLNIDLPYGPAITLLYVHPGYLKTIAQTQYIFIADLFISAKTRSNQIVLQQGMEKSCNTIQK